MKVYLLYPEREWANVGCYADDRAIIQDLGLKTLFLAAAKEFEKEDGKIKLVREADVFLEDTMKKVMMVPLRTEEEILYRQEILRDCYQNEEFICALYDLSGRILREWDRLGRKVSGKIGSPTPRSLVTKIHVLQMFVSSLTELGRLLAAHGQRLLSRGLKGLQERLDAEFSQELRSGLERILKDVAFYASENEHEETTAGNVRMVSKPKMVLGCRIGDGLKLDGLCLHSLATESRRFRPSGGALGRAQDYFSSLTTASFSVRKGSLLREQADKLEYELVCYIISSCEPFFDAFSSFFDQLHFQAAFYRGAINLGHYMERFHVQGCFPQVWERGNLRFQELKELVMAIEQRTNPVGNTCCIEGRQLLVVTGANQGGKSTFLRSIGIAQIMMQCGLPVAAESFASGIYPSFFTHFTRREDSAMNSGRLNEELKRMSQIVDRLEGDSMVLLNESFASTTEKEGSLIAYDVIRALTEAGVEVLTVTHLLTFAQRLYAECSGTAGFRRVEGEEAGKGEGAKGEGAGKGEDTGIGEEAGTESAEPPFRVEFFCAQRLEDGRRTFKMVQHAPELTSFGLDLYDKIIPAPK